MKFRFDATIEPDFCNSNAGLWEEFARDGYKGGAILEITSGKNWIRGVYGKFDSDGYVQFDLPDDFEIVEGATQIELCITRSFGLDRRTGNPMGEEHECVGWNHAVLVSALGEGE